MNCKGILLLIELTKSIYPTENNMLIQPGKNIDYNWTNMYFYNFLSSSHNKKKKITLHIKALKYLLFVLNYLTQYFSCYVFLLSSN